jgi:prevent-host-death family protein
MPQTSNSPWNLEVDLTNGVVPISKAASSLAALIKRSQRLQQPIIITQKGSPTGVILPVELYTALAGLARTSQRTTSETESDAAE